MNDAVARRFTGCEQMGRRAFSRTMAACRTGIVVRELQTGNYVCRKGDPYVWVGVIDGLVKAENLSVIGKSGWIRRGAARIRLS
jgi:hypothetical protein